MEEGWVRSSGCDGGDLGWGGEDDRRSPPPMGRVVGVSIIGQQVEGGTPVGQDPGRPWLLGW